MEHVGVERCGAAGYRVLGRWTKPPASIKKPAMRGVLNMAHAPTTYDIQFEACGAHS